MKPTKVWVVVALAVAVVGITATWLLSKHQAQSVSSERSAAMPFRTEPAQADMVTPPATPVVGGAAEAGGNPVPPSVSAADGSPPNGPKPLAKVASAAPPKKAKEPPRDPMARVALAFVGADPDAEAYWCDAINDPSLSEHERSDLIEDLNEEGLSDPKRPTLDDLPLIQNRLRLIQALAPEAMDQVNFDAFAEAYQDLLNLADVAVGGGQPVR